MRADIMKDLLRAHLDGDEDAFRKAALQIASTESAAGHIRVAEELRGLIAKIPVQSRRSSGAVIDLAQPRGELADVLDGGYREERLRDIVLAPDVREQLERILHENRARADLEKWAVSPRRRLLFCGPPGCGKTLAAAVLAGELGVPLMTVRLDALFSRFLGATATHLRAVFNEMPRRPGVYFFDEFDAVGKMRGDAQDVGELRRVVTSFLQMVDADRSPSILIAATNHPELLDRAVFRRFEVHLTLGLPRAVEIEQLLRLRLGAFDFPDRSFRNLARAGVGLSCADIAQACDDAIRTMALAGRALLTRDDVHAALVTIRLKATGKSAVEVRVPVKRVAKRTTAVTKRKPATKRTKKKASAQSRRR